MTHAVRRAGVADLPMLLPLVAQYWRSEGLADFDAHTVGAHLGELLAAAPLGAAWLAERDGRAAGYLLAVFLFSLEYGGITTEIDELYVIAAARGAGIGAALLAAAEADSMQRGHVRVALQLGRHNQAGRAFYRAHGYRERQGFELMDKKLDSQQRG
jgi:ribosomal protein S18 acetylase RimI-like enzyme